MLLLGLTIKAANSVLSKTFWTCSSRPGYERTKCWVERKIVLVFVSVWSLQLFLTMCAHIWCNLSYIRRKQWTSLEYGNVFTISKKVSLLNITLLGLQSLISYNLLSYYGEQKEQRGKFKYVNTACNIWELMCTSKARLACTWASVCSLLPIA